MTPAAPSVTVLLVQPVTAAPTLADAVVRPAATASGGHVRTAALGTRDRGAADAAAGSGVVLLDRLLGWTAAAGQVLGAAEALGVPVLALVPSCDDADGPPLGRTSRAVVLDVDLADAASVRAAVDTVSRALDDHLGAAARRPALGPAPTGGAARPSLDARGAAADGLDRAAAEALIAALYLDGLGDAAIEAELLRRGAPASWARSRLQRRPGW